MTKAKITGSELRISEREMLLAGSTSTMRLALSFSDDWNGLNRQITFTNEKTGVSRRISADADVCVVPWEVLSAAGSVSCYVRGLSGGVLTVRTNEENLGTVMGRSDSEASESSEPTSDVYDELAAKMGSLSNLQTSNKTNLVSAINEAAQSGGTGGQFSINLLSDGAGVDDADLVPYYDSSATGARKMLWSGVKSALKAYFDTLYNKVTRTSDLVNDSGFLTAHQSLESYRSSALQDSLDALKQTKAITDAGAYFDTDTVEGALQELGAAKQSMPYTNVTSGVTVNTGDDNTARVSDFSYTMRYYPALGAVYMRMYFKNAISFTAGTLYKLVDIPEQYKPAYITAVSAYCKAGGCAYVSSSASNGKVSLCFYSKDGMNANYAFYVAGLWLV